jgi:hypothetical protein
VTVDVEALARVIREASIAALDDPGVLRALDASWVPMHHAASTARVRDPALHEAAIVTRYEFIAMHVASWLEEQ